jgi:hypothetical protein
MTTFHWITATGETVPLDGSTGVTLILPVVGLDVAPVVLEIEQRIAYDGGVVFRYRVPPRPFSLPLDVDEAVASMRDVARWFAAPVASGGTLVATTDSIERTLETVVYEAGLEGEYSGNGGGGGLPWRQVTLNLLAMDPWWYGPVDSDTLNIGTVTAFDAAIAFDDVLTPFDGGDTTLLAVAGDAPAFPRFVIDGPFTTLTLDGAQTGETIELAAPLASGDQIVVDSTPGNRGPVLNGGVVDWSLLTSGSRLFQLATPSDTVSVNATGTTGASMVTIHWRDRYLTP